MRRDGGHVAVGEKNHEARTCLPDALTVIIPRLLEEPLSLYAFNKLQECLF